MSYKTRIFRLAKGQIGRWGLSPNVLVEVYLRLTEVLPANPTRHLLPIGDERGGMVYYFDLVDPENRFRRHSFAFQVFYGQDEETLLVASGVYRMDIEA